MGDEMDECACFWSHEFAMRRLLALLRQGQSYCTDTECIDLPSMGPGAQRSDDSSNFTLMSMLLIFAVILYLFRPNSLRRSPQNENAKTQQPPSGDGNDPNGAPPAVN